MTMHLRRALVTGASAGIGRAIATHLAGQGSDLVLVARTADRLEELATELSDAHGITAEVLAADLTAPDDLARVADRLADEPEVDVLVNNAGFGTTGPIADEPPEGQARMVALNVLALTQLSTAAAAIFRDRGRGGILNISSLAGFQPMPDHTTYGASKAFVTSFTQGLHQELKAHGVHVSVNCPGYTHTEFHATNDIDITGIPQLMWMDSDEVARVAVEGLRHNRALTIPGGRNRAIATLSRALPDAVTRRVAHAASNRLVDL